MGGPARPLHEPGNHRSSERCSHRHSADRGSLIGQPTLLRITAPTPRPGARSLRPTFGRRIPIWEGHNRPALERLIDALIDCGSDRAAVARAVVDFIRATTV